MMMRIPAIARALALALALSLTASGARAKTSNCSPADVYQAGASTEVFSEVYAARLAGDSGCNIPLYTPNESETLMVRLESYGLVGDTVHVYQVARNAENASLFYQVYFPESEFWAWVPAVWVELDQ